MIKLKNYSNYEIYPELGKIWSIPRKDKLGRTVGGGWVGSLDKDGYWQVTLIDDNGKQKTFKLHRLIWESVNGKIPEGYEINHKSERKDENFISNLELVTHLENVNYGTGIQRRAEKRRGVPNEKLSKTVGAYKDGILIMVFPSTREAHRQGFDQGAVAACCRGERKSHRGLTWQYVS